MHPIAGLPLFRNREFKRDAEPPLEQKGQLVKLCKVGDATIRCSPDE